MNNQHPTAKAQGGPAHKAEAKSNRRNEFLFVVSDSFGKPESLDRKMIRSHVVRGKGRPPGAGLRKPRIGSWIKTDDKHDGLDEGDSRGGEGPIKSSDEVVRAEESASRNGPIISVSAPAFAEYCMRSFGSNLEVSAYALNQFYKSFAAFDEAFYPPGLCHVYNVRDAGWFKHLSNDLMFLHMIWFSTEAYLDSLEGPWYGRKSSNRLAKLLPLLQERLEDSATATTDSTISVISCLAIVADIFGDVEAAKKHARGLHKVVTLRGGVGSLDWSHLQIKCYRVDLQLAVSNGTLPLFFADGVSWEPFFSRNGQPQQRIKLDTFLSSSDSGTDDRLGHTWTDTKEFCAIVNLAYATDKKLPPRLFQEIIVSVQYRLLHLDYSNTPSFGGEWDAPDRFHEAVRLGMLGFCSSVFLQVANMEIRYSHLASRFEEAFLAFEKPTETVGWEMRLWLLFIASSSLLSSGTRPWLKAAITECLKSLHLVSWPKVKETLKEFLWIDKIHDTGGKKMFELWAVGT